MCLYQYNIYIYHTYIPVVIGMISPFISLKGHNSALDCHCHVCVWFLKVYPKVFGASESVHPTGGLRPVRAENTADQDGKPWRSAGAGLRALRNPSGSTVDPGIRSERMLGFQRCTGLKDESQMGQSHKFTITNDWG